MLLSAVSVLVVAQSSSEIPEGLMNNPVFCCPIHIPRFKISDGQENLCSSACKVSGFLSDPKKCYCQNVLKFQNTKLYAI